MAWTGSGRDTIIWNDTLVATALLKSPHLTINSGTIQDTPTANKDIVNKKYVDDAIAGEDLWDRAGTVLSPKTAGDDVTTSGLGTFGGLSNAGDLDFTGTDRNIRMDTGSRDLLFFRGSGKGRDVLFYGGTTDLKISLKANGDIISTNDINLTGELLNTMEAADNRGIEIDGTTNAYTGTGNSYGLKYDRAVETASGVSGFSNFGVSSTLNNSHILSGTPFIVVEDNIGTYNFITATGAHSASPMIYMEENNVGVRNNMRRTGTLTSGTTYLNNYGTWSYISNETGYNRAGKTLTSSNYGSWTRIYSTESLTAGNLNVFNYGNYLTITSGTEGTVTNYGLYIGSISAGDTAYGIYDGSGRDWVLDGDNQKISIGETNTDLEIYSDGTDACIDFTGGLKINGAAGASGNFTTTDGKTVTVVDGLITAIV